MARVWPAGYDAECYVLLPVPVATVPIVAGKIAELENRSEWATESDWESGYQFAACLQDCLMQCGQSFAETMMLLAVALGANEIDQADLSPVFPALAARLAAARAADTAGVLTKQPLTAPPSTITRLSELLGPLVAAGDPGGSDPNLYAILRSAWNFDSINVSGIIGDEHIRETNAILATMAGLNEADQGKVVQMFPKVGLDLQNRRALNDLLDQNTTNNRFSNLVRLSELTRVLQGEFPGSWWSWLGLEDTDYPQLFDLYSLQAAGDEIQVGGNTLWDYLTGAVNIGADAIDIVTDIADSAVTAGSATAGVVTEGASLVLQAGLIGAIVGLSSQIKKISDNQEVADLNDTTRTNRILNILGGQEAVDNPQTVTGKSMLTVLQEMGANVPGTANFYSIEQKIDTLLQGSDTGDGRVNLWALDQSIDSMLFEMQMGQIYTKLSNIEANVAIAVDNGQHTGKINLRDIWSNIDQLKTIVQTMEGYSASMQPALDFILAEINKLMDTVSYTDRVNLHDLLQQLTCICKSNREILILQDANEPYGTGSGPGETTTAPSDLCQRARWLMDRLATIAYEMFRASGVTAQRVQNVYAQYLGVTVPGEQATRIALMGTSYVDSLPPMFMGGGGNVPEAGQGGINMRLYVIDNEAAMRCAILSGGNALYAHSNWNIAADGLGAGALPLASILKEMAWAGLFNQLFAAQIPLDSSVLSGYSNDCSDCAGIGEPGAGGDPPPAEYCAVTEVGVCGPTTTINSYKYRPTRIAAHAEWDATRADTNGYLTGSCGAFSDDGVFMTTNMRDFTLQIIDNAGGYGYAELVAQGGVVFWADNPQSDSDLETAASANQITDSATTVSTDTTFFVLMVKYPDTEAFHPNPLVKICPPA